MPYAAEPREFSAPEQWSWCCQYHRRVSDARTSSEYFFRGFAHYSPSLISGSVRTYSCKHRRRGISHVGLHLYNNARQSRKKERRPSWSSYNRRGEIRRGELCWHRGNAARGLLLTLSVSEPSTRVTMQRRADRRDQPHKGRLGKARDLIVQDAQSAAHTHTRTTSSGDANSRPSSAPMFHAIHC